MNILEQEIEQVIFDAIDNYDHDELRKRGLPIFSEFTYERQLDLGSYGRADLVGFHVSKSYAWHKEKRRDFVVQIIELKKDKIDLSTLLQALRYGKGLLHKFNHENIKYNIEFRFVLVGKSIDTSTEFVYLTDLVFGVSYYTYQLSLKEGITFKKQYGYQLPQPSFKKDSDDLIEIIRENASNNLTAEREKLYVDKDWSGWFKIEETVDDIPF